MSFLLLHSSRVEKLSLALAQVHLDGSQIIIHLPDYSPFNNCVFKIYCFLQSFWCVKRHLWSKTSLSSKSFTDCSVSHHPYSLLTDCIFNLNFTFEPNLDVVMALNKLNLEQLEVKGKRVFIR